MSEQPPGAIQRVVIVGGGTAGWMAAAALSHVLGKLPGLSITLIESDAIGTIGVGEATIPQITLFNEMLGIDEAEFMRATRGTYKFGIEFVDWLRLGHSYVHPFGTYGIDMLGIEFHHFWLKGGAEPGAGKLDDYSLAAVAGKRGRFIRPRPDQLGAPIARIAYAYQFDAGRYAQFLRVRAERQGVVRVEGRLTGTERDPSSGNISAVVLEDGHKVVGDLFVDCSGFRSLLLGGELGVEFTDWTDWLPCDRAVAVPCAHPAGLERGQSEPLTRSTARSAGWQWRIPLQHRIGNGYVYSSRHISTDEATAQLLASLDGPQLAEPNQITFRAGHRNRPWERNVVALGLAAGFLEPLESTAIHLVQSSIARLLSYFPGSSDATVERERFNRETVQEYVDIRDFLVLHYLASERDDSAFWTECRHRQPTASLTEKLAMFRATGRVLRNHNELFTEASWLAVLVGQGVTAAGHHPAANLISANETDERLCHIRQVVADNAAAMPSQAQFLQQIGGAIDPQDVIRA